MNDNNLRKAKKIWIDLDNSPHVPFFFPIIGELRKLGYNVFVTVRDCFQVCGLANYYHLNYTRIGRHYGKHLLLKALGTVWRSVQLTPLVFRECPDLSVSHGSRSLLMTSSALRIPSVLLFDYEHTSRLPFSKPMMGIMPEFIQTGSLNSNFKIGVRKYSGLKEDVYAPLFTPDPAIISELSLDASRILVTVRPPATEAHYHNPEGEGLFIETIDVLGNHPEVQIVILPRNEKRQTKFIESRWQHWCDSKRIIIPERVVNGLNLIWHSDLVISGGGTMNREAAALDVPVYSIFRGKLGNVDEYLSSVGRLIMLQRSEDLYKKLVIAKRPRTGHNRSKDSRVLDQVVNLILEPLRLNSPDRESVALS